MLFPPLYLRKNADRRLRAGHLWIYSNEVDIDESSLSQFPPGQLVTIYSYRQEALGTAYVNPHSLICARLLSHTPQLQITLDFFVHRLKQALVLRERCFKQPYYRLVYGEGDCLPGLIIDRFDEVLVVQLTTAGMEKLRHEVLSALEVLLKPRAIVLRNDTNARILEGLPSYTEIANGTLPEEVIVEENGARFHISPLEGQKTGWFYDHRLNRERLCHYVHNQRVLDVFTYMGAWGIQAALAGAKEVVCIDSSQKALDQLRINARLNQVADRVQTQTGDAFEVLKALRTNESHYDVVILDPPAFIKRRKDMQSGEQAYRRLNQLALKLLNPGGILLSASCSLHLQRATLLELIGLSSRSVNRYLQVLEQGHQSPDHPVHPVITETNYLKAFICRVL